MLNGGIIQAAVNLNIQNFMSGIRQITSQARAAASTINSSFSQITGSINSSRNAANQFGREMKDLERIVGGILLSQAFYSANSAIQEGIGNVISFNNQMEQAQIAFKYFLGDADKAEGFLANMKDFAAETSFDTGQAVDLSRRLLNARFEADQIRAIMERLNDANAVAGASPAVIDRLVLAMTQMKTNGRVMGGELRQFAEAGIPIYQILQEKLQLTNDEMSKIGDLRIPADVGIQALMEGLERFNGAAEEMADTVPGMWQTITDSMLILSEDIFAKPYQALKNFLTVWRDGMDEARDIVAQTGIGGLFEHWFPPSVHISVRLLIVSFQSLANSAGMIIQALQPAIALMGEHFTKALAAVIPPIASIVNMFARMFVAAQETIPGVRWLTAAIIGLMVANTVSKTLVVLWNVMRLGTIASVAATAVNMLTTAIRWLTITMARNPILALVMAVGGGLIYLAMQSKTVVTWLDALTQKLAQLGGFDISQTLVPEDQEPNKWIDEYNKSLGDLSGGALDDAANGIGGVGDAADKSGKKAEEAAKAYKKFLASFDEVHQVNEEDDDKDKDDGGKGDSGSGGGGGAGPGNALKIPPLQVPKIELPDLPREIEMPELKWPDPLIPAKLGEPIDKEVRIKFTPPSGGTAWAEAFSSAFAAIEARAVAAQNAIGKFGAWVKDFIPTLNPGAALAAIPKALNDALKQAEQGIKEFMPSLEQAWNKGWNGLATSVPVIGVAVAVKNALPNIANAVKEFMPSLEQAWNKGWEGLKNLTPNVIRGIGTVLTSLVPEWLKPITSFGSDAIAFLVSLGPDLASKAKTAFSVIGATILIAVKTAAGEVWKQVQEAWKQYQELPEWAQFLIETIFLSALGGVVGGLAKIGGAVTKWLPEAGKLFGKLGTLFDDAIKGLPKLWEGILSTVKRVGGPIIEGIGKGFSVIGKWFSDVVKPLPGNFASWIKEIPGKVSGSLSSLGTTFTKYVKDPFIRVIDDLPGEFTKWIKQIPGKVSGAVSGIGNVFSTYIKTPFVKLVDDLPGEFVKYVKQIPGKVSGAVSGIGGKFSSYVKTPFKNIVDDLPGTFTTYVKQLPGKVKGAVSGISGKFSSYIKSPFKNVVDDLPGTFTSWLRGVPGKVKGAVSGISGKFSTYIKSPFSSIVDDLPGIFLKQVKKIPGKVKEGLRGIGGAFLDALRNVKLPTFSISMKGFSAGMKTLGDIAGFATGGVIDKDSIVRVGERGKREAIIPLQNAQAMAPFADAVAARIMPNIPQQQQSTGTGGEPIVYVQYMIADDRGIRELERKLRVVRLDEDKRSGRL